MGAVKSKHMADESFDSVNPKPQSGDVWQDRMYDEEVRVKYADDEVVLIKDEEDHHHVYAADQFRRASKRSLTQNQNRFAKKTDTNDS